METKSKVFYHGSKKHFKLFDQSFSYGSKRRAVLGVFWFSDNLKVAQSYGKVLYETKLEINKPYIVDANFENYSEIYLSEIPKKICDKIDFLDGREVGDTYNEILYRKQTDPEYMLRFDSSELAFAAKKVGYDSIIIKNVIDAGNKSALKIFANTYAVFNPSQISILNVLTKSNAKRDRVVIG